VFIGGSDARIIIGPDEAALQCYGEKAGRWGHMTFRVTCWSSWGSQRQGRSGGFASAPSASPAAVAETCPSTGHTRSKLAHSDIRRGHRPIGRGGSSDREVADGADGIVQSFMYLMILFPARPSRRTNIDAQSQQESLCATQAASECARSAARPPISCARP
jgi:hypothetical protein